MYNVSREPMGKVSYKAYVDSNANVPDYSKLRVYKPSDGNKYIVCLLIANQLALAQIDSGSHYTVITGRMVAALGLSDKVTPSNKRYAAANEEA